MAAPKFSLCLLPHPDGCWPREAKAIVTTSLPRPPPRPPTRDSSARCAFISCSLSGVMSWICL